MPCTGGIVIGPAVYGVGCTAPSGWNCAILWAWPSTSSSAGPPATASAAARVPGDPAAGGDGDRRGRGEVRLDEVRGRAALQVAVGPEARRRRGAGAQLEREPARAPVLTHDRGGRRPAAGEPLRK